MLAGKDALPKVATSRCRVNPICVNMNVNDYNPGTESKGQRLLTYTISKSKCYSRYETRNELRYYEPPVLVTYGLRIGITPT